MRKDLSTQRQATLEKGELVDSQNKTLQALGEQLQAAKQVARTTQLRLQNHLTMAATTEARLRQQLAQHPGPVPGGVQDQLTALQTRYHHLMQAYTVGKQMYLQGKEEMQRRDAAHNQLVQLHMSLTLEEQKLETRNRLLTTRVDQLLHLNSLLSRQPPDSYMHRHLVRQQQEIDDLAFRLQTQDTFVTEQFDNLRTAHQTIRRLRSS